MRPKDFGTRAVRSGSLRIPDNTETIMKHMKPFLASALLLTAAGLPAWAQSVPVPGSGPRSGTIIQQQPNTTGNDSDLVIARGATGADTATTNSAAGGNANLPERAIPNGSAGGSSGGR